MTFQRKLAVVVAAAALVVVNARPLAGESPFFVEEKDGSIIHVKSGTSFPAMSGDFLRLEPHVIDPAGNNVAVGYSSRSPIRAELTEYVRFKDITISAYYLDSRLAVLSANKGLNLVAEDTESPVKWAAFMGNRVFDGREQAVMSSLFVSEHGDWLVKIRLTFPFPQEGLTSQNLEAFLQQMPAFYPRRSAEDGGS